MTDLIEKYDGRLLAIGDEWHEVRGHIQGRAAVSLKAPDGTIHEISSEDFRLRVATGFIVDRQSQDAGVRIPSETDNLEVAFRQAVLRMSARLEREGLGWQERHRVMKDNRKSVV